MADVNDRLHHVLRATAALTNSPDLGSLLRHVVTVARDLFGVPYAALHMIDQDGKPGDFVYEGVDERTAKLIGALPAGHGLFGKLLSRATPIHLDDMSEYPGTAGFPEHHPSMKSFLGVPIRIQGRTRGRLYLADPASSRFSADDETLVLALATSAATAIENTELRALAGQTQRWHAASALATRQVLGDSRAHRFDPVARMAQQTADADFATLALATEPDGLRIEAATGTYADDGPGRLLDPDTSLAGQVIRAATPMRSLGYPDIEPTRPAARIGSVLVVPVPSGAVVIGALSVGRLADRGSITDLDADHLAGFAEHLGPAVELSLTRAGGHRPTDVDHVGAEIHEHVVPTMFSVSLGLENLMTIDARPAIHDRLARYVHALDDAIDWIRATVYGINSTVGREQPQSLHYRVLAVAEESTAELGISVTTTFAGRLDSVVPDSLTDTVIDTVRRILRSIAEHACATRVELNLTTGTNLLSVDVVDDGAETWTPGRIDTLAHLREQAEAHAGRLELHTPPGGGTRITWTAATR